MTTKTTALVDLLQQALPGVAVEVASSADQPTLYVPREQLVATCRALREDPALGFDLLADLTAVDWLGRDPRFELVYHLARLGLSGWPPARLRLKVRVPGGEPRVPTVSGIWPAADWLEREVWDLFGIVFEGHPDLRRLLMPDDWEGHPLRKDYPVQINRPVDAREPLQVSEEEFLASIRAARARGGGEQR
jgi:NADH-quinone oxidoreductase subunit C